MKREDLANRLAVLALVAFYSTPRGMAYLAEVTRLLRERVEQLAREREDQDQDQPGRRPYTLPAAFYEPGPSRYVYVWAGPQRPAPYLTWPRNGLAELVGHLPPGGFLYVPRDASEALTDGIVP